MLAWSSRKQWVRPGFVARSQPLALEASGGSLDPLGESESLGMSVRPGESQARLTDTSKEAGIGAQWLADPLSVPR